MASAAEDLATAAALLAIPEHQRFHEVIDGVLVRKASPSGPHGRAQSRVVSRVGHAYDRRKGGRLPGGWWILTEVEVQLEETQIYRPDVVGWRRERLAELPEQTPIEVRPDWVCEVLSESNASNDLVRKMRGYHRGQIPHYWVVDPSDETLTVYRWTPDGFLLVLAAERGERVRAEPFDEVELLVGVCSGTKSRSRAPRGSTTPVRRRAEDLVAHVGVAAGQRSSRTATSPSSGHVAPRSPSRRLHDRSIESTENRAFLRRGVLR